MMSDILLHSKRAPVTISCEDKADSLPQLSSCRLAMFYPKAASLCVSARVESQERESADPTVSVLKKECLVSEDKNP
mgnify:FL=1